MKYLLTIAVALVALASTAFGQLAAGDTPALTNNVQYVWGTNGQAQCKALWNEDYQTRLAAYQSLTNAPASTNTIYTSNGNLQSLYPTNTLYLTLCGADSTKTETIRLNVLSTNTTLTINWITTNLVGSSSLTVEATGHVDTAGNAEQCLVDGLECNTVTRKANT